MFVQRLTQWLRKLVASLFHRHTADPLSPERTAVLTATLRGSASATTSAASWLDDSRRLRPRPSPLAKLDQQWNTRVGGGTRQPVPAQPHSGRAAPQRPTAEQPPAESATRPRHSEPSPPRAPSRPGERSSAPSMPALPSMPANISDQLLHRRLMGLKRLVRLGIYNEGFDPARVPEQYRYSLGYEDDPSVD